MSTSPVPPGVSWLLFRGRYSQSWGGCFYPKGCPRSAGLHVQQNGVDYLWILCFGATSEVYVGAAATERLAANGPHDSYPTEEALRVGYDVVSAEVAATLTGNAAEDYAYRRLRIGIDPDRDPWTFDGERMTPAVLVARGNRILSGSNPRLSDEERWNLPAAVAERAERAATEARREREKAAWNAKVKAAQAQAALAYATRGGRR